MANIKPDGVNHFDHGWLRWPEVAKRVKESMQDFHTENNI